MINKLDTLIPVAIFLLAWITGPVVIFLSALISTVALAASEGASSGTSDVILTINNRVQITSVTDITLDAYGGSGALTGPSDEYVIRNGGDDFKLKLVSDTGAFQVGSANDYQATISLPVSPI